MLIDGTGRAPLMDAVVVIRDGRFQEVGPRGKVTIPGGAEVIDARGKTLLPGLIDGHCHYRDWMGEVYLYYGVTVCPDISNNPTDWILAQREGVRDGRIRGPRVWATGSHLDGPPPKELSGLRRQRASTHVETAEQAVKTVQELVRQGVDALKFFERLNLEAAKAGAEEARRLGKPIFAHTMNIFEAAELGYKSAEHSWSVVYTSIGDAKKKQELDVARMTGKILTDEVHAHMEPAVFDKLVKTMVEKGIHWSPTWATWFRELSPRASELLERELAILRNPKLDYLPGYILKTTQEFFAAYEKAAPEKRAQLNDGYKKLQDFVRRFVAAGGKLHTGSDPNKVLPAFAMHAEFQMLVDAGISPVKAIQTASLNVAQAWGKEKDFGSVEKGKIADLVIVRGDPTRDIFATQDIELVLMDGKKVDRSFTPGYKNPLPRPIADRPE